MAPLPPSRTGEGLLPTGFGFIRQLRCRVLIGPDARPNREAHPLLSESARDD